MEHDEFIRELKEKFFRKGTWFKCGSVIEQSVLETIKALLLKKNLIIVSKVEWDRLNTKIP